MEKRRREVEEKGLRNFACYGIEGLTHSKERCAGFARAVELAGRPKPAVYNAKTQELRYSQAGKRTALARWLKALPKPVGIMAIRDHLARRLVDCCRANGIDVPGQAAVVGVNNDLVVCESSPPTLSSVALALEKPCAEAVMLLERLIIKKEKMAGQKILIGPAGVVQRQSSQIAASGDELVDRAIGFIRDNSKRNISVNDVADELIVSRPTLHSRFKKAMGCSVGDFIARVRSGTVAKLLVETRLSVTEIAEAAGFESPASMIRFFRRHYKTTPLQYRRKNR